MNTGGETGPTLGFRPSARRRNRIAAGAALGALAIGGNVLAYARLAGDQAEVVQAVDDILAGEQITADQLRVVDGDFDESVNAIDGGRLDLVVGQYAKVRIVSGSLLVEQSLQPDPLVSPGRSVLAIPVPAGELPIGLRERSPIELVIPPPSGSDAAPTVVPGRLVGIPTDAGDALGARSVTVEVDAGEASTVASAEEVRVVLVQPTADPASTAQIDGAGG